MEPGHQTPQLPTSQLLMTESPGWVMPPLPLARFCKHYQRGESRPAKVYVFARNNWNCQHVYLALKKKKNPCLNLCARPFKQRKYGHFLLIMLQRNNEMVTLQKHNQVFRNKKKSPLEPYKKTTGVRHYFLFSRQFQPLFFFFLFIKFWYFKMICI